MIGLLTFLRYRFPCWPIHPIGLTFSASDNNKTLVLPVFIAWACKSILMRVGGVALYRRAKPLFPGPGVAGGVYGRGDRVFYPLPCATALEMSPGPSLLRSDRHTARIWHDLCR